VEVTEYERIWQFFSDLLAIFWSKFYQELPQLLLSIFAQNAGFDYFVQFSFRTELLCGMCA